MGNSIFRNRHWYYRSLYDDYAMREIRYAIGLTGVVWVPHYLWGVHFNRLYEEHHSHVNYVIEYMPRRNRLTHSLLFEQFEVLVEKYQDLEDEFRENKEAMLEEAEKLVEVDSDD
jgi:hypothetical protein